MTPVVRTSASVSQPSLFTEGFDGFGLITLAGVFSGFFISNFSRFSSGPDYREFPCRMFVLPLTILMSNSES